MDWISRLNSELGRHSLGGGRIEFLHWAYQEHLPDNRPHRHTYFEACLVGRYGGGTFYIEGRPNELRPGIIFVARPGVIHQIVNGPGPEMELYWVSFGWKLDDATSEKSRLASTFLASEAMVTEDDGSVITSWSALELAAGASIMGNRERLVHLASSLVLSIAIALVSESEPEEVRTQEHAVARLAVRYVEDNLTHPLTLQEIAHFANVSPRHLTRLFREFTGDSPIRYVLRARLDRASALLLNSRLPIKTVSEQVGFSDEAYFSRCFRRFRGTSPAAFRASQGSGPIVQAIGALV
jgi:AraC-like DNA-binding protein